MTATDLYINALPGDGGREWMTMGACVGQAPQDGTTEFHPFFARPQKGVTTPSLANIRAKRICAECAVNERCLAYALANNIRFGVWGGTDERERRQIRRRQARKRT